MSCCLATPAPVCTWIGSGDDSRSFLPSLFLLDLEVFFLEPAYLITIIRRSFTGPLHFIHLLGNTQQEGANQHVVDEDFYLSKVYSTAMQPSKVMPYYFKAEGVFDKEEVTITTLITENR